jgi:hypothetical protein
MLTGRYTPATVDTLGFEGRLPAAVGTAFADRKAS